MPSSTNFDWPEKHPRLAYSSVGVEDQENILRELFRLNHRFDLESALSKTVYSISVSPEAMTNIIFGVIMILLGLLEMFLVERIVSRHHYRMIQQLRPQLLQKLTVEAGLVDLERQFLPMESLTTALSTGNPPTPAVATSPVRIFTASTNAQSDENPAEDQEEWYDAAQEEETVKVH
jgi:hypothetical protein